MNRLLVFGILSVIYSGILFGAESDVQKSLSAQAQLRSSLQTINPKMANHRPFAPIFFTGRVQSDYHLSDNYFGVSFPKSVKYQREVHYCQYKETIPHSDDGEAILTEITYSLGWHPQQISSENFYSGLYFNPIRSIIESTVLTTPSASVGNIKLQPTTVKKLGSYGFHGVDFYNHEVSPAYLDDGFYALTDHIFYAPYEDDLLTQFEATAQSIDSPHFTVSDKFPVCNSGDILVIFRSVPDDIQISAIGAVNNENELVPVNLKGGLKKLILKQGLYDADEMITSDVETTRVFAVVARAGSVVFYYLGTCFFAPIVAVFLPFLGVAVNLFLQGTFSPIHLGGGLALLLVASFGIKMNPKTAENFTPLVVLSVLLSMVL
ncbi:hypothetical protein GEMRC1_007472 [Eukaryota sp. GEM-RC1]